MWLQWPKWSKGITLDLSSRGTHLTAFSFPLTLFFLGRLTEVLMGNKCTMINSQLQHIQYYKKKQDRQAGRSLINTASVINKAL